MQVNPPPPDGFAAFPELLAAAISSLGGLIGRLMAISQERRDVITLGLFVWELPTAIGMGLIAKGLADHMGWVGFSGFAVTIVGGYLGPRLLSSLVQIAVDWYRRRIS